ncbi:MAG: REP-associated tyrosine transposase [Brevirhabdus sp.]
MRYRRDKTPGGTWFFTVCLKQRGGTLLTDRVDLLRRCVAETRVSQPFGIVAWVVLPDHMHCIWTLPEGDADFPNRWKAIKGRFSRAIPDRPEFRAAARRPREKGVWQNRYWEHRIRDRRDLGNHLRYSYLKPVRNGLATKAQDWPFSSIHRDIRQGLLPPDWSGQA